MNVVSLTKEKLLDKKETLSAKKFIDYLQENVGALFSTPDLAKLYSFLKDIDVDGSNTYMPKLIISWLAFLNGDHSRCFLLMNNIQEAKLSNPYESSFFYSLKALMSGMLDINDAKRYGKLAIDILPQDEKNIYLANAYLTYGQLCSGTDQYLMASEMFADSFKVFYDLNMHFLASIAFVNEVLNLFKIGEYKLVMKKCQKTLIMIGNFNQQLKSYWNIIHLPLGLCYYELNKLQLALEHLTLAKQAINQFDLFHMYGITEIYLFKTYYILNDSKGMDSLKNHTIDKFALMKNPMMDQLIIMFTIYSMKENLKQLQPMIEKLEVEHYNGSLDSYSIVTELLVYLKLKGLSDAITLNELEERLEKFSKIGNISMKQLTLIQLTECCLLEKKEEEALLYLS